MTQVVSFIIQKGGCGKTTSTVNTAGYLAQQGYKVLCVDLDPQGNLTQHFGYDSDGLEYTLLNLFKGTAVFEKVVLKRTENLHIIPNNIESAAEEIPLFYSLSREFLLRDVLLPLQKDYDFILIDCPPNLGLFSVNALVASTEFVMVVAPEFFPMKAIKPLYDTFRTVRQKLNHSLQFKGVLMTLCDFRTRHSQEILKILRKNFPHKLFKSFIRANVTLKEAASYGQSIFEYDGKSIGAFDYQSFAEEFIRDYHKNIQKRNYYQQKFLSLPEEEKEQIILFAKENLSGFNQIRMENISHSKVLQEALIVERNRVLEKLFPYRSYYNLETI